MPGIHTERSFEEAIEHDLTTHRGYAARSSQHFDAELCLDPERLIGFLQATQPEAWQKLAGIHQGELRRKFLYRLTQEIDKRGLLDVIRNGVTDYGVKFQLAYFRPETSLNPETQVRYGSNQLDLMRQVHYSPAHKNSLDLVILLNGLPIITIELKNQLTGQSTRHAKRQYIEDRDPREQMFQFNRRSLVHFAVDDEEVWFTTKLDRKATRYFPFNRGHGTAAGNPPAEGYRTAYLWEEVLQRDSLLDLVGRFLHLEVRPGHAQRNVGPGHAQRNIVGPGHAQRNIVGPGHALALPGRMIFPRYHQMDVVRRLTGHARQQGPGRNYLIQHSAGSGKSNSIAWLAYRLSSLHDAQDQRVFDSVIVITDRRVLDSQLQETIYQFEHKLGVVEKIDQNSTQLAEAITHASPIIITTLQKFPFVLDKVADLPKRRYAVIVDEAHSSQGGEASKQMKQVLSDGEEDDDSETVEDEIRRSMEARGRQANLSFFAFTATPKAKTLAVFGEEGGDGKHRPFHLYSMRQAIQEGFILDVLKHYRTYQTYYKIRKEIEDDPELNKKKANQAIGRYLSLHPHNIAQKVAIIIEHFREVVSKQIGGKAKAMLVAGSREHALRYYRAFNAYLAEHGYQDIKALVAFSGTLQVDGQDYRESELNGFGEKELPEQFAGEGYQVLIVADKYQTGFDQPLLHTMYVDKKLSGVKAVQTLSRLNRTCPGKEDTFVLDFANKAEDIQASFQPFYEVTRLDEPTSPNHLYDLRHQLEEFRLIDPAEIEAFAQVYFKPKTTLSQADQAQLYRHLRPATDRYQELAEKEQDEFKQVLSSFLRAYSLLSQVMPFQDEALEKFYAYGKLLRNALPKRNLTERLQLDDEVALEYYRLDKVREGDIALDPHGEYGVSGTSEAGIKRGDKEDTEKLSKIIEVVNERFGTDFTEADQLFFDQMEEQLYEDDTLRKQAQANSMDNFRHGFEDAFMAILIARMSKNEDLFNRIMEDEQFAELAKDMLMQNVYRRARGGE